MRIHRHLAGFFVVALFAIVTVVGCSSDSSEEKTGAMSQVVDSLSATLAEGISRAAFASSEEPGDSLTDSLISRPADEMNDEITVIRDLADFVFDDVRLYAVFDGGFVVYDFTSASPTVYETDDRLTAITWHLDELYLGGDHLYTFANGGLEPLDVEFDAPITELYSYGHRLMIGTENGLYERSAFGDGLLYDDVSVSAMVADETGLWIGTQGQGLYRWDGETFSRRYLLRDTSFFDFVNALDFKHQHLYMGTSNGLHIYDGGRWETFTEADGLPSTNVTSLDASDWVVIAGTDAGVASYFNRNILPVTKLDDRAVTAVQRRGRDLILATQYDGILVKEGNVIKTLVQPVPDMNVNILSLVF
jgi:hypothetical protein